MIIVQLDSEQLSSLIQSSVRKVLKETPPQTVEPTPQTEQLLNIDEVAELLHLSKATIYSKVSKNELPGVCKQGKRLYFDRQTIIDWIKQGRIKSNIEIAQEAEAYLSNNKKALK